MKILPMAAVVALTATGLAAQEKNLTTAEIQELLVGKTVEGIPYVNNNSERFRWFRKEKLQ